MLRQALEIDQLRSKLEGAVSSAEHAKLLEDNVEMRQQLELSLSTQQKCRAVVERQKDEIKLQGERVASLEAELEAERAHRAQL